MAQVREILERKGSHVLTVAPAASVLQAALLMNEYRVERHGSLLLLNPGSPTERRRAPACSYAEVSLDASMLDARVVQL